MGAERARLNAAAAAIRAKTAHLEAGGHVSMDEALGVMADLCDAWKVVKEHEEDEDHGSERGPVRTDDPGHR